MTAKKIASSSSVALSPNILGRMSKYRLWHDSIIAKARSREDIRGYFESHHVKPRSLGGSDLNKNLVNLSYREHFLVHWLLTKMLRGGELRKMQLALFAMTMKCSKNRTPHGWQLEVALRAIRDLEVDPIAEAAWRERFKEARLRDAQERYANREHLLRVERPAEREMNRNAVRGLVQGVALHDREALRNLTNLFLKHSHRKTRTRMPGPQKRSTDSSAREAKLARLKAEAQLKALGLKFNETPHQRPTARATDRL